MTPSGEPHSVGALPLPPLLTLAGATPLVGRTAVWQVLESAWAAVRGRARQVVLVPGEVGTGKTRLITEFARHVHADGGAVLFGTCSEHPAVPYQPFGDALGHLLTAWDPDTVVERLGDDGAELGRLLLGRRDPRAASAPPVDPDLERARLFGAVVGSVRALAVAQPVLLVLDDMQWATRPTIDVLLQLLQDQRLTDVLVIVSYRSAPADIDEPLRGALPELRRTPGVGRVPVHGFDRQGVRAFVTAAGGRPDAARFDGVVDELARLTDGNVFLLVELWQHLLDTGSLVWSGSGWVALGPVGGSTTPDGVREVVGVWLARLDATTRRLLELAAVIGPTFDTALLAGVADLPVEVVLDGLDAAARSRMIGEYGPGGHRFGHELIRRAVYDDLGGTDRRTLHLAVARRLAATPTGGPSGEIATHLRAAMPLVEPAEVARAVLAAADAAMAALAYDDAVHFLDTVLELVPDVGTEVLLRSADAMMRAGDVARAKQRCLEAFGGAHRRGDDDQAVAAALAFSEACWRDSRDAATAVDLLRRIQPSAADEGERIKLQASLTRALALSGDGEAARVLGEDVLASARCVDDAAVRRLAFDAVSYVPWRPQSIDGQLATMRDAATIARAAGDLEWENHATSKALYGEILAGDLASARRTAARHHELAASVGQPIFRVLDAQAHAMLAIAEGRFSDAERLAGEADELVGVLSDGPSGYGVQLFAIRREQGRLDEARPVVEAIARLGEAGATWRSALTVMYAELGMLDEAAAELDLLTADRCALVPRDALWLGSLSFLADACCLVGHEDGARVVYGELLAWRGRIVQVGHLLAAHGAVDRFLGELAAVIGRDSEAAIHLAAAVRIDTAAQMPVWVAHSQLAHGRFLARGGGGEDTEHARALLAAAHATAERLGMATVVAQAAAAGDARRCAAARRHRRG